jgi:hypothetical protein
MGNTAEELAHLIATIFGAEWSAKLLNAVGPEGMLTKYQEIVAVAADSAEVQRRQQLVFATKPLVRFLTGRVLGRAGSETLHTSIQLFPVMGMDDWRYAFANAVTADSAPAKEKKVTTKNVRLQDRELPLEANRVAPYRGRGVIPDLYFNEDAGPPHPAEPQPQPNFARDPFGEEPAGVRLRDAYANDLATIRGAYQAIAGVRDGRRPR